MWLIIGYGNRFRGDDAAGLLLAENLVNVLPADKARVLAVHQLTPELVEELLKPEIKKVLFIDVKRGQPEAVAINPVFAGDKESCGHQVTPALLLLLATQLYAHNLPGWLLTISGNEFSFAEGLTQTARKNFQLARQYVIESI